MTGFDDLRNRAEGTAVQPSAGDRMRQEYLRQQRQADMPLQPGAMPPPGSDQMQPRNSIYSQNFDNPITHLDRAKWYMQNEGARSPRCMQEYYAAIRAADMIDQREVAEARRQAQEQLRSEQDPMKRRQLAQWDATLHDMQRAPGFTRANLGMLWIRMGYQGDGIRLVVEAGQKDPEMRTDPNFIRHMQMLNMQMPGDRGGPAIPPGYDNRPPGVLPNPGGDTRQPGTDQVRPSGTVRPGDNFEADPRNPFAHLGKANEDFARTGQLTPEIRARFAAAVQAADNLDRDYIAAQLRDLNAQAEQAQDRALEERIVKLTKERDDLATALKTSNPDSVKKLADLNEEWKKFDAEAKAKEAAGDAAGKAAAEAQRKAVEDRMAQVPGAASLIAKQKELDAAEADPKHMRLAVFAAKIAQLTELNDSSSLTRFAYAFALANDARLADQIRAGNLGDAQRVALKEMAQQANLTAEQKTALNAIADKTALTEQDRTQLKQLAGQANLTADQKAALGKITQQFNLTDAQKTALQQLATQERQTAAQLMDQIVKIDSKARTDNDFKLLAREVGYQIPQAEVSERVRDQAPTIADLTKDGNPIAMLADAHQIDKDSGFAAAKPKFEAAVTAADKLDANAIKQKVEFFTNAAKDTTLDDTSRAQAIQMATSYELLQHSPFVARMQYAIKLSNAALENKPGGDAARAKQLVTEAAAKDPEAANQEFFKFVKDKIEKGQKITDEDLQRFAPRTTASADGGTVSPELAQVAAAMKKIDDATKVQNNATAAEAFKEAIVAADKMDMTGYKKALDETKAKLAALPQTPEGIQQSGALLEVKKQLEAKINLPSTLRLEFAKFYIRNHQPDKAKELFENAEFLAKYSDLVKNPGGTPPQFKSPEFKAVYQFSIEYSKGTLEKAMDWAKKEGKGLVSDFGSMGVAGIIFAMNPEAGLAKRLGLSVLGGMVTKPALQMAMLEKPKWSDVAWGGANALMGVAGGEARTALRSRMAANIDEAALKSRLMELGVKDTLLKDFAVQQDLRNVDAIGKLMRQQFGEKVNVNLLREQAEKLGVSGLALKELEGKTGVAAIDAWVGMLQKHSVNGLNTTALMGHAATLGLDGAALKEIAAKQELSRVETVMTLVREKLGEKVDGKKLVAHAKSMGIPEAEALAQLEGKVGREAVDSLSSMLRQRAEAGTLNMGLVSETAGKLGVDKFELTRALAAQERASIDTLGDLLKKGPVDPTKLAAEAKAMGIPEAELKALEGKTGAEAVDAFTAMLKKRAEVGLSMAPLNELAAKMGVSKSALTELATKRQMEGLDAVEKVLTNHIDDQRKLAKDALDIARKYKLDGLKEGNGALLSADLKKLGVPEAGNYPLRGLEELAAGNGRKLAAHLEELGVKANNPQLKAIAEGTLRGDEARQAAVALLSERMTLLAANEIKGAEASRLAVSMVRDFVATKEKTMAEAYAAETAGMGLRERMFYSGAGKGEASAFATSKTELDALKAQITPGRLERLGSWARTWLPGKGAEGSIYREYTNLWASAKTMQGRGLGPIPFAYFNPNNVMNLFDKQAGKYSAQVPLVSFRDVASFKNLNDLNARNFWNKYKVDFASIGLMSLMYRGSHNAVHVVTPDERTGKTLTPWEAAKQTVIGTGGVDYGAFGDALGGAFLMPIFRELGGAFRGGSLAESLAPTRAPWQQVRPGVWSKVSLSWQAPTYALETYVTRPLSNLAGSGASYLGEGVTTRLPRIPMGLSTVGGTAANFSPRLQEIPGTWSKYSTTSSILEANKLPLVDKNTPIDPLDAEMEMDPEHMDPYKRDMLMLNDILDTLQQQREQDGTSLTDEPPAPSPTPNPNPNPTPGTSDPPPATGFPG